MTLRFDEQDTPDLEVAASAFQHDTAIFVAALLRILYRYANPSKIAGIDALMEARASNPSIQLNLIPRVARKYGIDIRDTFGKVVFGKFLVNLSTRTSEPEPVVRFDMAEDDEDDEAVEHDPAVQSSRSQPSCAGPALVYYHAPPLP